MCGCTLQDYPEHRLQFFNLLRSITNACSGTLFTMSPVQLKLVIDSIVWAFRHTERNVADTGAPLPAWPLPQMCPSACLACPRQRQPWMYGMTVLLTMAVTIGGEVIPEARRYVASLQYADVTRPGSSREHPAVADNVDV